ncbi:MAG: ATP-binding protein, partial [Chloroflexota bacterium]
ARLVQGMPLGVVLAARWAELLSMDEIAKEISRNLDFLDTTMQDLPPRQRSVRAVFDTSWRQLTPAVQEVFARLSVFRGGFTREAAREVTGADLHALLELVRKSFVTIAQRGRYEVHELLRQYGEEQLLASDQAEDICDAHSAYYLRLMGRLEEDLKGRRQTEALREIEADFQNLRHAWTWAVRKGDRQGINQALEALHLFCDFRGRHQEAIELFAEARRRFAPATGEEPDALWGRIVSRHGFLHVMVPSDPAMVQTELERGLEIALQHDDPYELAVATLAVGTFTAVVQQDAVKGAEICHHAYRLLADVGEPFFQARALVNLGLCAAAASDPSVFAHYMQQSVEMARSVGDKVGVALGTANLTEHAVGMGQYDVAEENCNEAIALSREIDVPPVLAFCQAWRACLDLLRGQVDTATVTLNQSLTLAQDTSSETAVAYASCLLALSAGLRGDYEKARRLALESRANPANNTLGLVLAPWALTIAYIGLQNRPAAAEALREALEQAQTLAFPAPPLWLLPVAALLIAEEESQQTRAVELLALASTHPLSPRGWMKTWAPLRDLQQRLRDELDADTYKAAWERGKDLDVSAVVMHLIEHVSSKLDRLTLT